MVQQLWSIQYLKTMYRLHVAAVNNSPFLLASLIISLSLIWEVFTTDSWYCCCCMSVTAITSLSWFYCFISLYTPKHLRAQWFHFPVLILQRCPLLHQTVPRITGLQDWHFDFAYRIHSLHSVCYLISFLTCIRYFFRAMSWSQLTINCLKLAEETYSKSIESWLPETRGIKIISPNKEIETCCPGQMYNPPPLPFFHFSFIATLLS